MTQFGTTDSATHLNHILPTPYTPSFIGRHPIYPKASPEITTRIYNPIYSSRWQKSSDNYAERSRDYHCSTYAYLGPEWFKAPPKHYQTYKEPLRQPGTKAPNDRPQSVPNHASRSNDDWARAFDDYPGRFKIEYASPDDVNALCFKSNLVQTELIHISVQVSLNIFSLKICPSDVMHRFSFLFIRSDSISFLPDFSFSPPTKTFLSSDRSNQYPTIVYPPNHWKYSFPSPRNV